ncbi:MAG: HypC/HybG/HupF family hydrogenase formation chaperone [Deltaproteobacteria bacterium]|nr:MAG: HypC/HybG/HupF family hydrogenase formation chaperone [Deltaproteobacteria bacterium]
MCLGVPGKVVTVEGDFADVDFGGVRRKVSLLLYPEVGEGDYVLVHVGFVIQRLEEHEALETLELFAEIEKRYEESTDEER